MDVILPNLVKTGLHIVLILNTGSMCFGFWCRWFHLLGTRHQCYFHVCRTGPSLFSGLDYWTGLLDWTTGLDYWTGLLDWTTGLDYWTGLLDWTTGLDYWTGLLDWTTGLDYWTGLLDWTTGLDYWTGLYWTGLLEWTTGLTKTLSGRK